MLLEAHPSAVGHTLDGRAPISTSADRSLGAPLADRMFRGLWLAGLISSSALWTQNVAVVWAMTTVTDSAVLVALIPAATTLPMLFLALPAGALADVADRRRLLILAPSCVACAVVCLGGLSLLGWTAPWSLLVLSLLCGT